MSIALLSLIPSGCTSKKGRATSYAAQTAMWRAALANAMAADWRAGNLLLDDCLDLAFAKLDTPADPSALIFAGAVLDFAAQVQAQLPKGDEYLLLYFRIGGLAGHAATVAYNAADYPTARSLVLAGPSRWQSDAYWDRHPNHDALVARLMFLSGEESESIRWLRRHDAMHDELQRAYDEIAAAMRARSSPPSDSGQPSPSGGN